MESSSNPNSPPTSLITQALVDAAKEIHEAQSEIEVAQATLEAAIGRRMNAIHLLVQTHSKMLDAIAASTPDVTAVPTQKVPFVSPGSTLGVANHG
jgi:hypothetical protein